MTPQDTEREIERIKHDYWATDIRNQEDDILEKYYGPLWPSVSTERWVRGIGKWKHRRNDNEIPDTNQ